MPGGVTGPLAWGPPLSPAVNLLFALSGLQAPYSHNKGIDYKVSRVSSSSKAGDPSRGGCTSTALRAQWSWLHLPVSSKSAVRSACPATTMVDVAKPVRPRIQWTHRRYPGLLRLL